MASSLLALLDDIATVLDDVAVMTKVATKKTAGVLGDDLALNAQQVHGVAPDRELPVVWAVAKGSFINKAILVPAALFISTFAAWAVMPLMVIGGAYLCYEGAEKLAHRFLHKDAATKHAADEALLRAVANPAIDLVAFERDKIRGAIRTDFILSAEIIVISLGTVAGMPFMTQLGVLIAIGLLMTIGVYGFVAAIVKIDDVGLHLSMKPGTGIVATQRAIGRGLLMGAPYLMKTLTVVGTAAMFLVGGGILVHAIPAVHHALEAAFFGPEWLVWLESVLAEGMVGLLLGAVVLAAVAAGGRMRQQFA